MKRIVISILAFILTLVLISILLFLNTGAEEDIKDDTKEAFAVGTFSRRSSLIPHGNRNNWESKTDGAITKGSDCRTFLNDATGNWKYHQSDSVLTLTDKGFFEFRDYPVKGNKVVGYWEVTSKGIRLNFEELDKFWTDYLNMNHEKYDWGVISYSLDQRFIEFETSFYVGSIRGKTKAEICNIGSYYINIFNTLYYEIKD